MSKRRRRFYPSSRNKPDGFVRVDAPVIDFRELEIFKPPFKIADEQPNKVFNEWKDRFCDAWINPVASLNSNNSITQFTTFNLKRLSYAECANLAIDTIIVKAISTITNEIFNKRGDFKIISQNVAYAEKIILDLEDELAKLDFWNVLSRYASNSLIYGVSFLYIQTKETKLAGELYHNFETASHSNNHIDRLKVVEPWCVGVSSVQSANPLNDDYMNPSVWFVGGAGEVHRSRLIPLSFFEVPNIIKPVFNYGGVSLCQLMKDYVKDAEGIRMALSDLFLRFRSMIIKSPKVRTDLREAQVRAKAMAEQQNNLGIILLSDNEEYYETITNINGLDKLQAQAYENMCIASHMPATKLLGISPSGFNSTGEFDLKNYYDTISGFQNNIIKPVLLEIAQIVLWNMGVDATLDFDFAPLEKQNQKEMAEIDNLTADYLTKINDLGIVTSEQLFEIARKKGIVPETMELEAEDDDLLERLDFKNAQETNS